MSLADSLDDLNSIPESSIDDKECEESNTVTATRSRHMFRADNDAALMELVRVNSPYTTKRGNVAKIWESISLEYQQHIHSDNPISWKVLRNRASLLITKYHGDEIDSLRKSGTVEKYSDVLIKLHDIVTSIDDHHKRCAEEREIKQKNEDDLVSMGDQLRMAALNRISIVSGDSLNKEKQQDGKATKSNKRKIEDILEERQTIMAKQVEDERAKNEQNYDIECKRLRIKSDKLEFEKEKWKMMELKLEEDRKILLVSINKLIDK